MPDLSKFLKEEAEGPRDRYGNPRGMIPEPVNPRSINPTPTPLPVFWVDPESYAKCAAHMNMTKPKKGYWSDDLTRIAEAKKIRTVSGAKLRVKVEEFANTDLLINFKQFDFSECYKSNGKVKYEGNSHPLDIAQIWIKY